MEESVVSYRRRDFLKLAGSIGAGAVMAQYSSDIVAALERAYEGDVNLIWLQGQGCTADTISLIQGVNPDLVDAVTKFRVNVAFHPTIMAEEGDDAIEKLETTDPHVLVVEGSIPQNPPEACTVGRVNGEPVPVGDWVEELAPRADAVVAVGNCACFGGIPAARNKEELYGLTPSPTDAVGLQFKYREKGGFLGSDFRSKAGLPVINVSGCMAHPDWMLLTIASLINGVTPELDRWNRPLPFFGPNVHDECSLRGFFDKGEFAEELSEDVEAACLYKLGCKGPYTFCDDSIRQWNDGTSVCRYAGAPCIGCMEPDFWDRFTPFYDTLEDVPLIAGQGADDLGKLAAGATGAGIAAHAGRRAMARATGEGEEGGEEE